MLLCLQDDVVGQLERFNAKCLRRYDIPELIGMSEFCFFANFKLIFWFLPGNSAHVVLLYFVLWCAYIVQAMSDQGCSADAVLDAEEEHVEEEEGHGFGAADGVGHYALELGQCDFNALQANVDAVDRACCRSTDADDACGTDSGVLAILLSMSCVFPLALRTRARVA